MKTIMPSPPEIHTSLPRGRHSLTREQVRTSQRTRLQDAFAELIAEKGYAKVTIADIVAKGGVAKRTFYEYFEDKEACFHAGSEYLADKIAQAIVIPHDPNMNLYRRAEAAILGLLQVLQDHPSYARASFVEVWAAGDQAIQRRLRVTRQLAQLLVSLSRDMIRETHALAVISAIDAYLFRVIYAEGAAHLTDHVETCAQLVTGFLKADMSRIKN